MKISPRKRALAVLLGCSGVLIAVGYHVAAGRHSRITVQNESVTMIEEAVVWWGAEARTLTHIPPGGVGQLQWVRKKYAGVLGLQARLATGNVIGKKSLLYVEAENITVPKTFTVTRDLQLTVSGLTIVGRR